MTHAGSRVWWRGACLLLTVAALWLVQEPSAWAAKTGTLYDLIQQGTVEVTTAGSGIESVSVKVRRKVAEPVTVQVPVGTFFVSGNAGSQNMVTVGSTSVTLTDDNWRTISVPAACANRTRDIPGGKDTFTVQQSPQHADLAKVIPLMEKDRVSYAVKQAAVWIITDNATYADLGILISRRVGSYGGGTRVIGATEAARAMKYCADAGVDITKKAIWRDRDTIGNSVGNGPLEEWVLYDSVGYLAVTTTPPGAVVSVVDGPTGGTSPCRLTVKCRTGQPRAVLVQVSLPGYLPQYAKLTVTAGAETPCALTLTPMPVIPAGAKLGEERTNPLDGAAMVWVPAGEFLMGNTDNEGESNERPQHRVYLDGYWIYKYEVTVAQYRAFCAATGWALPPFPSGHSWKGKAGWADPALQNHPIVNVTWHDATAYAAWAGAQLPTEAQWEKAARGTEGRIYPWGNAWDLAKCANDANSDSKGISTWPVGSFPAGVSWCGAHDMAGNVWEWCADWYDAGYYKTAPTRNPTGPATGTYRVLRGGSWDDGIEYGCRGACRSYNDPGYWGYGFGFRCLSLSPGP